MLTSGSVEHPESRHIYRQSGVLTFICKTSFLEREEAKLIFISMDKNICITISFLALTEQLVIYFG